MSSGTPTPAPTQTPPRTPPPVTPLRTPTRFSWVGIALLGGAAVIAFVVTVGIFLPAIGELGRVGQDPASLPRQLSVCDRTWDRGQDVRVWTLAEVAARDDREPIVFTASGPGVCPTEACGSAGADEGCATVIYVRKGQDEYVPYDLVADQ